MTKAEKILEKAMAQFDARQIVPGRWNVKTGDDFIVVLIRRYESISDLQCRSILGSIKINESTTVGDVCKFISENVEHYGRAGDPPPPPALKGTGPGGFEELLMKEADRLENLGVLTMGRYPVASVVLKGSKFPMQVPSLPDFEGVNTAGRQFIIEAKVCSDSAFKIAKNMLKPKQVRHLLTRARFNVLGFLLIHFNEREGKTFYDPPFTVGIRILPESEGGLPVWEKFAADKKGTYAGSIDRAEARELGTIVEWYTPKRCRSPRPHLQKLLWDHR